MMERDAAWKRVCDALPVAETLEREGLFAITADELKRHGGREPRLMAKIDTLAERPAVLAELGASLFPVRNGKYALFPDPAQKSFFRFEGEPPPARAFAARMDLGRFDTFPQGHAGSESQALDAAFLAGLLASFCGESSLCLTLRGRMFSGAFSFRTPLRGLPIDVARVQIEVDAGYEGEEGVYLIEAKRGRRDDFHIRQLWYPYLHWSALTRKRVVPIFFTYSNGQFELSEFAFGPEYGDATLVRRKAYCLEEPLAAADFRSLFARVTAGPEPAGAFPQANDLDKIVDLVSLAAEAARTKSEIAEAFGFDERQGDYYGNAACYLGLLRRGDDGFSLTPAGERFRQLRSRPARTLALLEAMLAIPSLREALRLLAERQFRAEKIATGELAAVVREATGLGASTPERRASTVRAWLGWVMKNVKVDAERI
jgi:hypothetical protein